MFITTNTRKVKIAVIISKTIQIGNINQATKINSTIFQFL
jgi:hypothetical protein